eukprot:m.210993 g.210993  ORF g.210993 m.210993 type:complete len:787 (-) comp15830_c0_seq8:24-2384(-)
MINTMENTQTPQNVVNNQNEQQAYLNQNEQQQAYLNQLYAYQAYAAYQQYDTGNTTQAYSDAYSKSYPSEENTQSYEDKAKTDRNSYSRGRGRRGQSNEHDDRTGNYSDYDRSYDGHSRSRSRSRSRERDEGHDRQSWASGRDRHRDRDRRGRDRDRNRRDGDRRRRGPSPSRVLIARGIPPDTQRNHVWEAFSQHGAELRDVRIITDRQTGRVRDFCFVEFETLEEAMAWVEHRRPQAQVFDRILSLDYQSNSEGPTDWICNYCETLNFARRTVCFSCSAPRESSCKTAARNKDNADSEPSNVLIVKGLNRITTERTLQDEFINFGELQTVRLIREHGTGESRCFAFIQYETQEHAMKALQNVESLKHPLLIDDYRVTVAHARGKEEYAASGSGSKSKVASAAIEAAMAMSANSASKTSEPLAPPEQPPNYPQGFPILSQDAQSGWWYDPVVGYYYDVNTGYFYNGKNQKYLYFDLAKRKYMPMAPATTEADNQSQEDPKSKEKKKKTIEAKKIAKDMERWEKKRKRKDAIVVKKMENAVQPTSVQGNGNVDPANMSVEANTEEVEINEEESLPEAAQHVLQYSIPGLDPWDVAQARGHVDVNTLVCKLCSRRLGKQGESSEKLEKHVRQSNLHSSNVEKERQEFFATLTPGQRATFDRMLRDAAYKDRAADRRKQHGVSKKKIKNLIVARNRPAPPPGKIVQPTKNGIGEDNIGNKMLKAMGWSKGEGLGKDSQGITAPIEARMHQQGAGLGAAPVMNASEAGDSDSYHAHAAKMARARFNAMS